MIHITSEGESCTGHSLREEIGRRALLSEHAEASDIRSKEKDEDVFKFVIVRLGQHSSGSFF